jgi:hypothetical protein
MEIWLFDRDKTIKHIQIFFGGNNQIPELAYLCDWQNLIQANILITKHNLIIVFVCY